MINEDAYLDYIDEFSDEKFEKFAYKPKTKKVDKRTEHDLINEKRREKMNEKAELAEQELQHIIV